LRDSGLTCVKQCHAETARNDIGYLTNMLAEVKNVVYRCLEIRMNTGLQADPAVKSAIPFKRIVA
jgi:hypothetical protein